MENSEAYINEYPIQIAKAKKRELISKSMLTRNYSDGNPYG